MDEISRQIPDDDEWIIFLTRTGETKMYVGHKYSEPIEPDELKPDHVVGE